MTTKVTRDNLDKVGGLLEEALDAKNVSVVVVLFCQVCGQRRDITDLQTFAEAAAYIPPDPFPKGTRVVHLVTKEHGVVSANKVGSTANHHHRRSVEFQPDGHGCVWFYIIDKERNTVSANLVSEVD